ECSYSMPAPALPWPASAILLIASFPGQRGLLDASRAPIRSPSARSKRNSNSAILSALPLLLRGFWPVITATSVCSWPGTIHSRPSISTLLYCFARLTMIGYSTSLIDCQRHMFVGFAGWVPFRLVIVIPSIVLPSVCVQSVVVSPGRLALLSLNRQSRLPDPPVLPGRHQPETKFPPAAARRARREGGIEGIARRNRAIRAGIVVMHVASDVRI